MVLLLSWTLSEILVFRTSSTLLQLAIGACAWVETGAATLAATPSRPSSGAVTPVAVCGFSLPTTCLADSHLGEWSVPCASARGAAARIAAADAATMIPAFLSTVSPDGGGADLRSASSSFGLAWKGSRASQKKCIGRPGRKQIAYNY